MTDETPEAAEPTNGVSETSSGVSASEASGASDEQSESDARQNGGSDGGSSDPRSDGERTDPRDDEADEEAKPTQEVSNYADDADEIPLDITGHEDRSPPGEGDSGEDSDAGGDEAVAANGGTAAVETGTPSADAGPVEGADLLAEEIAEENGGQPADSADESDDEVEPIELLVQLAKDGEIDPWDIDVVEVTEEFLAALDEGSLRESGRALFYASVLVRLKSDVLLDPEVAEEAEDEWDAPMDAPEDAPPAFDPVDSLEDEMERRLQRKHVRGTPETLDELVRELREAERGSWWKEGREYDTSESPAGFDRGTQTVDYHMDDDRRMDGEPTAQEVTERTHGEDIEEIIEDVRAELFEHYDAGRPEVLFREVEDAGGSRVHTFLSVLFLANRGEIRLQQDQLFGDLWIQDPTAELGVEGAVAD